MVPEISFWIFSLDPRCGRDFSMLWSMAVLKAAGELRFCGGHACRQQHSLGVVKRPPESQADATYRKASK